MNQNNNNRPAIFTSEDIDKIIGDLSSNDKKLSESAHLSLITLGEKAIPSLTKAMKSKDQRIHWEAAKALAEMRNPAAAAILVESLSNPDDEIRWLAAEGLIALGEAGIAPLLRALVKNPTSTWLSQGAHHVIKDLYRGRTHSGEEKYMTIHDLSYSLREKLLPVLQALENTELSLKLPMAAQSALDYFHK